MILKLTISGGGDCRVDSAELAAWNTVSNEGGSWTQLTFKGGMNLSVAESVEAIDAMLAPPAAT
jgi:hypothetical protein